MLYYKMHFHRNTINKRIKICRLLARLTQKQTAEKLGIGTSTYSKMERHGNITVETVFKLAEIFSVHPDAILYDNPIPTEESYVTYWRLPFPDDDWYVPKPKAPQPPITPHEADIISALRLLYYSDRKRIIWHYIESPVQTMEWNKESKRKYGKSAKDSIIAKPWEFYPR